MICQMDISNIKAELDKNIGQKVMIRGAMGRKKESRIAKFEVENMSASINVEFKLWLKKTVDSIDLYPAQNCASSLNQAI